MHPTLQEVRWCNTVNPQLQGDPFLITAAHSTSRVDKETIVAEKAGEGDGGGCDHGQVQEGLRLLWKPFREQKGFQWCCVWAWQWIGKSTIFFHSHNVKCSLLCVWCLLGFGWCFFAQVRRKIDLIYGGGSVGLMGLISKTLHTGGCRVLG